MLKPSKRDLEIFKQLELAVINGDGCPENLFTKRLATMKAIRVERYRRNSSGRSSSCRIVQLLTGEHQGKHTAKPDWLVKGDTPIDVQDGRPPEEQTAIVLFDEIQSNSQTVLVGSVTLSKAPWE